MRFRHIAGGLSVVALATCGLPAAVSAAAVTHTPRPLTRVAQGRGLPAAGSDAAAGKIPWKRYVTKGWQDAPGQVCSFGVNVTIVRQHEQYRTTSSYPNGKPRVQEFRGPLFARYTNASTGKSLVGNLSGYGWFYYEPNGSIAIYVPSHIGLTVHVGNKGFPAGEWIFSGRGMVFVSSTGDIRVVPFHARLENVCSMLS
jgi:hypothetical protein